jgi:hypothetical protein
VYRRLSLCTAVAFLQIAAGKFVKREMYNNDKLATVCFDSKLTICIKFPDKPGEVSTQVVVGFKIWPRMGY